MLNISQHPERVIPVCLALVLGFMVWVAVWSGNRLAEESREFDLALYAKLDRQGLYLPSHEIWLNATDHEKLLILLSVDRNPIIAEEQDQ